MHTFTFNSHCCSEYGVLVSGSGTFNAPEKDEEIIEVPGRNGTLILSNHRYKNVTITYPAFIRDSFSANSAALRAWLLAADGYCRLTDDYHPGEFRMARFKGPLNFETRFLNSGGECDLSFDCKPQRFLTSGEIETTLTEAGTITNPTLFSALPLITVYGAGAGQLSIAGQVISISAVGSNMTLDCETENAYKGTQNKNNSVSGVFPKLLPGSNAVSWSGGITSVKIKPRWWTI